VESWEEQIRQEKKKEAFHRQRSKEWKGGNGSHKETDRSSGVKQRLNGGEKRKFQKGREEGLQGEKMIVCFGEGIWYKAARALPTPAGEERRSPERKEFAGGECVGFGGGGGKREE